MAKGSKIAPSTEEKSKVGNKEDKTEAQKRGPRVRKAKEKLRVIMHHATGLLLPALSTILHAKLSRLIVSKTAHIGLAKTFLS